MGENRNQKIGNFFDKGVAFFISCAIIVKKVLTSDYKS